MKRRMTPMASGVRFTRMQQRERELASGRRYGRFGMRSTLTELCRETDGEMTARADTAVPVPVKFTAVTVTVRQGGDAKRSGAKNRRLWQDAVARLKFVNAYEVDRAGDGRAVSYRVCGPERLVRILLTLSIIEHVETRECRVGHAAAGSGTAAR